MPETWEAMGCGNLSKSLNVLSILLSQNNIVNFFVGILHLPNSDPD